MSTGAPLLGADPFSPGVVDPLEGAIGSPPVEIVADGTAMGKVMGEQIPLTAGAQLRAQGVVDLAEVHRAWPSWSRLLSGQEGFEESPFFIGHIGRIRLA
jgi:hypothetical protein